MKDHVGIAGIGIYLPKGRMSAKDIAEKTNGVWSYDAIVQKLGIIEKVVPFDRKKDLPQEMGVIAALEAIKNSKIDPLEIDLILNVTDEWKEYLLTTSALYVQDKIKALNAWGIDVQNRCCTTLSALKMAKDMMLGSNEINVCLIVGGYSNGDLVDYTDKNMSMMYNLAAGGGAIILKKNHGKNLLLESKIISDGSLSRTAGVEYGGIINPLNKNNIEEKGNYLRLMDPLKMKNRLNDVSMENWLKCIDEALRKSNLKRSDIDFLNILHIKRSAHNEILKILGLNENQTIYLENYGHIGQIDQILTLDLALKEKKIKKGSIIVSIAAGIGYVWAANVIKWG